MSAPTGQSPNRPGDSAMPTDDPEWIKGVVARALLRATDEDDAGSERPLAEPISTQWPEVKTTGATVEELRRTLEEARRAPIPNGAPTRSVTPAPAAPVVEPPQPVASDPPPTPAPAPTPTAIPTPEPNDEPFTFSVTGTATPVVDEPPTRAEPATVAPPAQEPVTVAPPAQEAPPVQEPVPTPIDEVLAPEDPAPVDTIVDNPAPEPEPVNVREQVETAIHRRESMLALEPAQTLPDGIQDRRKSSVSVANPGRAHDDQLLQQEDATTEGFRSSDLRTILEWLAVIVAALTVALLIKAFVLQAFWIPSESMETTVNEGDRILVNKVSYRLHDIRRGDLVVFKKLPGTGGNTEDLIKRAIALPGETIEVRDDGRIWIWGAGETPGDAKRLEEPYLSPDDAFLSVPNSAADPTALGNARCVNGDSPTRCTLDDGSYFMLGDNRNQSQDSRFFGPVPRENVVGRAFLRIWPLSDIDTL